MVRLDESFSRFIPVRADLHFAATSFCFPLDRVWGSSIRGERTRRASSVYARPGVPEQELKVFLYPDAPCIAYLHLWGVGRHIWQSHWSCLGWHCSFLEHISGPQGTGEWTPLDLVFGAMTPFRGAGIGVDIGRLHPVTIVRWVDRSTSASRRSECCRPPCLSDTPKY